MSGGRDLKWAGWRFSSHSSAAAGERRGLRVPASSSRVPVSSLELTVSALTAVTRLG